MAWEPDRRSNFFFIPPAHLCAVTYMTEISLIVTLNNQFNSTQVNIIGPITKIVQLESSSSVIWHGFCRLEYFLYINMQFF